MTLVAVKVTVCAEAIVPGAKYRPIAMGLNVTGSVPVLDWRVPIPAGVTRHVTAPAAFATQAVKSCSRPALKVADGGVIVTDTGGKTQTCAEADFVGSATLVAVTLRPFQEGKEDGGVYRPVSSMLPSAGLMDQVTDVSTPGGNGIRAVNWCVCDVYIESVPGMTAGRGTLTGTRMDFPR